MLTAQVKQKGGKFFEPGDCNGTVIDLIDDPTAGFSSNEQDYLQNFSYIQNSEDDITCLYHKIECKENKKYYFKPEYCLL